SQCVASPTSSLSSAGRYPLRPPHLSRMRCVLVAGTTMGGPVIGALMPAFSHARWGHFVGLCGLFLLAEGLSRGVDGLLKIVKSEAYLRGSDAVILLDTKVWADITGHRGPAEMAQA